MNAGLQTCSAEQFNEVIGGLKGGVPDAALYQRLTTLILEAPATRRLARMDPFSPEYRQGALDLYLDMRARPDGGYVPERDEAPSAPVPEDIWSQLSPWAFRDTVMVGEHLYAWGHIMGHLGLPAGGSVLEYGPGSGQILLMLARMGFRSFGVDVDAVALESIRLQAEAMRLDVATECALFGEGFAGQRFDRILFYEAFHHSIDFQALLRRLHERLKPGGRVILCGEPVVPEPFPGIPYPWGPRMDALSVFCMRRFGWMELGFTHGFFVEAVRRAGWKVGFHPFPNCGRAHLYVLEPSDDASRSQAIPWEMPDASQDATLTRLRAELAAVHASTSWRLTSPLRAVARRLGQR